MDFTLRKLLEVGLFNAKPEYRPSTVRVNYSIALFKFKVYLYGGLNAENQILSTVEEFDASTYKFNAHKMRGDYKPKGRQGHCAIALDQYNMYIFGGSYQTSLIDPLPISDETGLALLYDMDANTFQNVGATTGDKPSNLVYASVFGLNPDTLCLIHNDLFPMISHPTSN